MTIGPRESRATREWRHQLEARVKIFQIRGPHAGAWKAVLAALDEGELPEVAAPVRVVGGFTSVDALLVASNRRVIFANVGLTRRLVLGIPYSDLVSVVWEQGLRKGSIGFQSHGRTHNFPAMKDTPNHFIPPFVKVCEEHIRAEHTPKASGPSGASLSQEIERLAALRDQGLLTDQEFSHGKARLLAGDTTAGRPGNRG